MTNKHECTQDRFLRDVKDHQISIEKDFCGNVWRSRSIGAKKQRRLVNAKELQREVVK